MKQYLTLPLTMLLTHLLLAQPTVTRTIAPFSQVTVSEGIDLVLEQGERPGLSLAYRGVAPEDIVTEVSGKKLKIYRKGCRRGCSESDQQRYRGARVIAYLTYTELNKLVVMGDNEVIGNSPIRAKKFVLRSYGDNHISLRNVRADRWKAALYGDSRLRVEGGQVGTMKIKTYGDNTVDTRELTSDFSKIHALGDSEVRVQARERIHITALGDVTLWHHGPAGVDKKLVLGELSLLAW